MSSYTCSEIPKWFSIKKAHVAQLRTSEKIIRQDKLPEKIRYVAGIDVAYTKEWSTGAAVIVDYNTLSLVESETTHVRTCFPYVPTLLSFREIPPAIAAIRKMYLQPDVFLVDGQGIMHPYKLGFASHLGLILGKPTIGVAKNPLNGKVGEFSDENWAPIRSKGESIGAALITKNGARPVYVSIGHMISLERAIEVVKKCTLEHRISEPLRLAHILAAREKQKLKNS